jgi:hypothetical protein
VKRPSILFSILGLIDLPVAALAGPVVAAWPVNGPDDTSAVASASLSGWYAAADSYENNIEIRDINQNLVSTLPQSQLAALLPWMALDGSTDGPNNLAFSDSGRLLFIAVNDANPATDTQPSDAVLRYDFSTSSLSVFSRLELTNLDFPWAHGAMLHYKGRLYIGHQDNSLRVLGAAATQTTGSPIATYPSPNGQRISGLTVDRVNNLLYVSWGTQIYRSSLASASLSFTLVGSIPNLRALAYSDHYGGPLNGGLYALDSTTAGASHTLWYVTALQLHGLQGFAPTQYLTGPSEWHDLAATADGRLLAGADEDAAIISDTTDARLSYASWKLDEFTQVVNFAKGLTRTDGWVIDTDVPLGGTRYHPATPDAAGWTVLLLLCNERINADAQALPLVRTILERYAGLAPFGPAPVRSADGIYKHWIDPATGDTKSGWGDEYATLSTMKIVMAAARAAAFYPADLSIQQSAHAIICGVHNWDSYIQPNTDALAFKGLAPIGPDPSSWARQFHEGIVFVAEAAAYGSTYSQTAYTHWLDRVRSPVAIIIPAWPVTTGSGQVFQPAFISHYPNLLLPEFRANATWRSHMIALRQSHQTWTDDNAPRFNTVFSAGTTKPEWGGYRADSLSDHPGDIATFTSLLAFSAAGTANNGAAESVGAYNAYRRGARQTFLSGASILYRRSSVDPSYNPNTAGMPDVALGALGLAELLQPGIIDSVLSRPMPSCLCVADMDDGSGTGTPDNGVGIEDLLYYLAQYDAGTLRADVDDGTSTGQTDGGVGIEDLLYYLLRYDAGC